MIDGFGNSGAMTIPSYQLEARLPEGSTTQITCFSGATLLGEVSYDGHASPTTMAGAILAYMTCPPTKATPILLPAGSIELTNLVADRLFGKNGKAGDVFSAEDLVELGFTLKTPPKGCGWIKLDPARGIYMQGRYHPTLVGDASCGWGSEAYREARDRTAERLWDRFGQREFLIDPDRQKARVVERIADGVVMDLPTSTASDSRVTIWGLQAAVRVAALIANRELQLLVSSAFEPPPSALAVTTS